LDWPRFPRRSLAAGRRLYRFARRSPWWFCTCGDCRFDLASPRGTCYLGTDPLAGVLESIGMEWTTGRPMTRDFLELRQVHSWEVSARTPLADLVSRRAVGFKVTNELSDMTPYTVPQSFAALFDSVLRGRRRAFGGIRFRTRFDTGALVRGVALFGDEGPLATPSAAVHDVDDALVDGLSALGVVVSDPPGLAELEVATDQ
jgi:hypothetical protein